MLEDKMEKISWKGEEKDSEIENKKYVGSINVISGVFILFLHIDVQFFSALFVEKTLFSIELVLHLCLMLVKLFLGIDKEELPVPKFILF